MFGLTKKTAWGFLIVLGIFVAIVAFGNIIVPGKLARAVPDDENSMTARLDDSLIGKPLAPEGDLMPESAPALPLDDRAQSDERGNLTTSLASFIGKSIVERNPQGPRAETLTVEDTERIANQLAHASAGKFYRAFFSPAIDADKIIISETTTAEAYQKAIERVMDEAAAIPLPHADAPLTERMIAIARRYARIAEQFPAIPVPPSYATKHQETIQIALKRQRILETVAQYAADPVYALMGLKAAGTTP